MRRVRARIFSIICLSLVFTILISTNCFPWGGYLHRYIAYEAAKVMPEYIRNILMDSKNIYHLLAGIVEPDENRIVDHQNISECAMMINRHARQAEKMIRKGEDWEKIVFTLGQAAHYIQDLNQPQHCSASETREEHKKFEAIAGHGDWDRKMYDGFHYIKKYRKFAANTSRFSVRYVKYTVRFKKLEDDEFSNKLFTPLIAHAINDTADLWLTIFKNGLGEEKYKELGLPEPIGIRGHKRIKYPKIKDL